DRDRAPHRASVDERRSDAALAVDRRSAARSGPGGHAVARRSADVVREERVRIAERAERHLRYARGAGGSCAAVAGGAGRTDHWRGEVASPGAAAEARHPGNFGAGAAELAEIVDPARIAGLVRCQHVPLADREPIAAVLGDTALRTEA